MRPRKKHLDHHRRKNGNIKTSSRRSKNDNSIKYMFFYGFIIFLIAVLIIIYINQYVELSRKNFKIEKLKKEREKLKTEKVHLQLKISRLKSLDRIERIAKNELGMKEPDEVNYLVVKDIPKTESKADKDVKKVVKQDSNQGTSIQKRLFVWFNNLTGVQAGTLDE